MSTVSRSTAVRTTEELRAETLERIEWDRISDAVATAFRLTPAEKEVFRSREVAQLIAAVPYLAGAEDPERTAIANLGAYLLSVRGSTEAYFNPVPEDDWDIHKRLRPYTRVSGGDERVVTRARDLLAYHMVVDYERDRAEDADLGQYNPVSANAVDSEALKAELLERLTENPSPEMDAILSAVGPLAWWQCC
jgi:hypothetical protein